MPIAYITDPADKTVRKWNHEKADLIFVFESHGKLGERFSSKGSSVLSISPSDASVLLDTVPPAPTPKLYYTAATYLLWRSYLIYLHFKNGTYPGGPRRRSPVKDYEFADLKRLVLHNKNPKSALELQRTIDDRIENAALEMGLGSARGWNVEEKLSLAIRLAKTMYHGWAAHRGIREEVAILYQSPALYTAIVYAVDFGFDREDFDESGVPTPRMLRIFSRLFNEKVVHGRYADLQAESQRLRPFFTQLKKGEIQPRDYMNWGD